MKMKTKPIILQGKEHILTIFMDDNGTTHFRLFEGDLHSGGYLDEFKVTDGSVIVHENFHWRR